MLVGKIVLVFIARPFFWWFGRFSAWFLMPFASFCFSLLAFGVVFSFFGFITLLGTSVQNRFGFRQVLQTLFPKSNFITDHQTFWQCYISLVCAFSQFKQTRSFFTQSRF